MSKLSLSEDRKFLRHAVIEQYRLWLWMDGPTMKSLSGNKHDSYSVRSIAKAYSVNRGIVADKTAARTHANAVAKAVNNLTSKAWLQKSIAVRGAEVFRVAETLSKKPHKHTHGIQASAVSKLAWFLKPNDWTMYDDFAARALKARNRSKKHRVVHFYEILHARDFSTKAAAIQKSLNSTDLKMLHGGRVIDKYLWLHGASADERDGIIAGHKHFLALLPKNFGRDVRNSADIIASAHIQALREIRGVE